MLTNFDKVLGISSREEFDHLALELFRWQAERCAPYRDYLALLGCEPTEVERVEEIPHLPIEIFRTHRVWCGEGEPEKVFSSSTTSGGEPSLHPMASLDDYRRTFSAAWERFLPTPHRIYALLPCYLEREGSSLVYMVDELIRLYGGGFYLHDHDRLLADMAEYEGPKVLFGVSYALLDLAERKPQLSNTIVIETGGMKGRRKEMPKAEMHRVLCEAFGVERIASEYGMAELTSQAYSSGDGLFYAPPWMRVTVRDLNNPFATLGVGRTGGVNIIDLANRHSCAFIESADLGRLSADGGFELCGRVGGSPIRGCNLLVDNE
ncbi:MAG: acyltransferase [Tidjanibacter sp.]|nr:acyltransferase [Tidjanibacter sp.]